MDYFEARKLLTEFKEAHPDVEFKIDLSSEQLPSLHPDVEVCHQERQIWDNGHKQSTLTILVSKETFERLDAMVDFDRSSMMPRYSAYTLCDVSEFFNIEITIDVEDSVLDKLRDIESMMGGHKSTEEQLLHIARTMYVGVDYPEEVML